MHKGKLKQHIILLILICSSYAKAAIVPYIVETKSLYFGNIVFVPGSCLMAYDSQLISPLTPQNICTSTLGAAGSYRIFANPNKQVQIKIKSHADSGNGIVYVPDGQLVSDVANALIIADTTQTINSGVSGIIDITLGGRLTINNNLASSSTYSELFDIEFVEL
ncbi:MAG: hypothetical protein COB83_12610 [Gammaproteobacteria bacterium]|nr:MAG: hypothetical protein COB83_12610 [Gammaproteobacteria bacterium]